MFTIDLFPLLHSNASCWVGKNFSFESKLLFLFIAKWITALDESEQILFSQGIYFKSRLRMQKFCFPNYH